MGKRKKTTEEFKQEVYDLLGNEYTVLDEYINSNTKINMKHNKCGHEYKVIPYAFLKGNRCPKCYGSYKKTTEQFKQEVYELVESNYTVLGQYVNNSTKIKMKHNKCGYEYMVEPRSFLRGSRCPKCANNIVKNTQEFETEVIDKGNNEYVLLSEYKNTNTKVTIKHLICGYVYEVTPSSFLKGSRCANCYGNRRKTTEQFKEEVYNLVRDEYSLLSEYINNSTKVKIKHNICNHIYEVKPSNFLTGYRCPNCANNLRKTTEQFIQEVYNLVGNEFTVLGEYVNAKTEIEIKHNKCGQILKTTPNNFLKGCSCIYCSNKFKKTTDVFKQEVYDLVGDEYIVIGEYITNDTKILIKHNDCDSTYYVKPSNFLSGNRCPKCKLSKGEYAISKILNQYEVKFEGEYKFKDCIYKSYLSFDFAIFKDDKLVLLIEYDGIQHYKPINRFGGEKAFIDNKLRDSIKTQYCIDNNIPLLRIPYWEFDNINKIILKKLFRLGLI